MGKIKNLYFQRHIVQSVGEFLANILKDGVWNPVPLSKSSHPVLRTNVGNTKAHITLECKCKAVYSKDICPFTIYFKDFCFVSDVETVYHVFQSSQSQVG